MPVVATKTKPPDVKELPMAAKNSCAILVLAVVTAVSSNTAVSGQEAGSPRNRYSKVTVRRDKMTSRTNVVHDHRKKAISFAEASKMFSRHKEWMIGANTKGWIFPNGRHTRSAAYNLKGLRIRKFLQFELSGIRGGISIGWTDDASAKTAQLRSKSCWAFYRESRSTSAIRYGEPLAILLDGFEPGFVNYGHRKYGIDLKRTKTPSYEWAILGGKPGELVRRGEDFVVLYNLKYQQPLIYFDRDRGGDIGWPTSRRSGIGTIHDSPQQTAKKRAAAKALLMPGVMVGK